MQTVVLGLWPSCLAYAISFLQLAAVWANHHNRFGYIARSDHVLLFLNIVFLTCAAFIPFATALQTEYIQGAEGESQTAVAVYSSTLAGTGIFFTLLWLNAAGNYRLVDRNLSTTLLRSMTRRYVAGMVLYILRFALSFVNVVVTLLLIVGLAPLFVLPEPSEHPRKTPATLRI